MALSAGGVFGRDRLWWVFSAHVTTTGKRALSGRFRRAFVDRYERVIAAADLETILVRADLGLNDLIRCHLSVYDSASRAFAILLAELSCEFAGHSPLDCSRRCGGKHADVMCTAKVAGTTDRRGQERVYKRRELASD